MADKMLKIGRNLAWLGSVMFAVLAVALEMFRQVRKVAGKRRSNDDDDDYYSKRDRPRPPLH
jgi:hypothetical protein